MPLVSWIFPMPITTWSLLSMVTPVEHRDGAGIALAPLGGGVKAVDDDITHGPQGAERTGMLRGVGDDDPAAFADQRLQEFDELVGGSFGAVVGQRGVLLGEWAGGRVHGVEVRDQRSEARGQR